MPNPMEPNEKIGPAGRCHGDLSILIEPSLPAYLQRIADAHQIPIVDQPQPWQLQFIDGAWRLVGDPESGFTPLAADFTSGKTSHRRKFGGGKKQDIAKAAGLNKIATVHIADFTAGLGEDAFVFASLGCTVSLFERNPVVQILLADGLHRASLQKETRDIVNRMHLNFDDSLNLRGGESEECYDVVYLDPMFPDRKQTALPKKEMRVLQQIVGKDPDSDDLLQLGLARTRYRVVVKRPKDAPFLANRPPTLQFSGKSSRFDVYVKKSLAAANRQGQ